MRNKKLKLGCQQQKGVALLIALMVSALIATIAIELTWKMELNFTRSANRWHGVQASTYLEGAENLAIKWLIDDLNSPTGQNDNLNEAWATPVPQMPTDHGYVSGALEDASARINLNSLGGRPSSGSSASVGAKRFNEPQRRFVRLLLLLTNNEGQPMLTMPEAEAITEAVIDWVDTDDQETGFGGAEADYYQQLVPPFVAANDVMSSVSELSLIKGITSQIYNALLPYVIALPANVTLNVNTAPEIILRTINYENDLAPLSEVDVQQLLQDRQSNENGLETASDFVAAGTAAATIFPKTKGVNNGPGSGPPEGANTTTGAGEDSTQGVLDMTGLGTKSDYFILSSETMVGDHVRTRRTLIKRDSNTKIVVAVRRTDANF